jgi:DNA-binding SARP family transcriptional activator
MPVRLTLFGAPRAQFRDQPVDIPTTRPAYLLLYLACQHDWVSRDLLAELLRPEADSDTARHNLRLQLTRAKKYSWCDGLEVEAKRVRWQVGSDLLTYKQALGMGETERALALYSQPLLADLPSIGLVGFDSWLEEARGNLHTNWRDIAFKQGQQLHTWQNFTQAAAILKALWHDDMLAEDIFREYVKNCYLAGQTREALEAYEQLTLQLQTDLNLAPSPATQSLIDTITRAQPLALQGMTPPDIPLGVLRPPRLIGRQDAISRLHHSRAGLTLVAGEAGIGKTRLLQDYLPDAFWLYCQEGLENVPYFSVTHAIRQLDNLPGHLDGLQAYRTDLARLLPELAEAGITMQYDAAEGKARLLEALARLLESLGIPIVVDDLQWADPQTLEFLIYLSARHNCKLYGSYRSNEVSELLERTLTSLGDNLTTIWLTPLASQDVKQLIAELSHSENGPPRFSQWLFERSAGNPFFALETLKALFETGRLRSDTESWHSDLDAITHDYHELEVPQRVSEVIQRRVRGLSDEARTLLEAASVVGSGFTVPLLSTVTGLNPWLCSDHLTELERRGFIQGERFSHDLLRESLYDALSESKRRLYHTAVAEALPLDDMPLVVAEHWYQAGELTKAADLWFSTASTFFDERPGFEAESITIYERILGLGITTTATYRTKVMLAHRYYIRANYAEALAMASEVLEQSDDDVARSHALLLQGTHYMLEGELSAAEQLIKRAVDYATVTNETALISDIAKTQVAIKIRQGYFSEALAIIEPMVAEKRRHPPSFGLINWLGYLAHIHAELGQHNEALVILQEQLDLSERLGYLAQQTSSYADILSLYQDTKQFEKIILLAQKALELPPSHDTNLIYYTLADAYLKTGDIAQAKAYAEPLMDAEISFNLRAHLYALLAELYTATSEVSRSRQMIDEGLTLTETTERLTARAIMMIAALRFGDEMQRREAEARRQQLDEARLSEYLKEMFRELTTPQ